MVTPETQTVELSVPLPRSLDTRIYLRLSTKAKAVMLFLTTASQDELAAPTSMGSFVYALPDVRFVLRANRQASYTNLL